jgi:hypothetical protein
MRRADADADAAKSASVHDDAIVKLIDASASAGRAKTKLAQAVKQRFGDAAGKPLDFNLNALLIDEVRQAAVHENGDRAELGDSGDYPCLRVAGQWKYDLTRLRRDEPVQASIDRETKQAETDQHLAADVAAGKYASPEAVFKTRAAAAPPPPPPPAPPAAH